MIVIHLKKKDVVKSNVKGVAIEFDHDRLVSILGVPGKNGICEYIKDVWEEYTRPLEITRRFTNNETLTAARRVKSEFGVQLVDKKGEERSDMTILRRLSSPCAVEGESRSDEQFYDAQVDVEEPVTPATPEVVAQASVQQKEVTASGVDPSCPTGRIPEAVMNKLQDEFERAWANRFQANLEKAQAENARLLTLLQQAQTKPKP
ncbi:hypothetical protein Dimus_024582 [Dionaea muscipula]